MHKARAEIAATLGSLGLLTDEALPLVSLAEEPFSMLVNPINQN